jgi:hypothetical protein
MVVVKRLDQLRNYQLIKTTLLHAVSCYLQLPILLSYGSYSNM